jgi:aryl-alcohol dehydrogenase-like predicted oxidoreductase
LEKEVEKGRIRYYGISSNTFPDNVDNPQFTSLSKVLRIAEKISSKHHFNVVQFPMNFAETYPAWRLNQPDSEVSSTPKKTLLDICQEHQLGVLINRPLNGIIAKKNALIRFSDSNPDQNLKKLLKDTLNQQHESSSWVVGPKTLSQIAIRALRTTPSITCVLVGMRREHYVSDILDEIQRKVEPIKDRKEAWRHIQELFG